MWEFHALTVVVCILCSEMYISRMFHSQFLIDICPLIIIFSSVQNWPSKHGTQLKKNFHHSNSVPSF